MKNNRYVNLKFRELSTLDAEVNSRLKDGWELKDALHIYEVVKALNHRMDEKRIYFVQTMVKEMPDDKHET